MGFLSMNWIWIAIAIGVVFYFLRRSSGAHKGGQGTDFRNLLDGPRHGGSVGHTGQSAQPEDGPSANAPEAALDPVGGEAVATAQALTSVHQGKVYYFATKENRDRFEASPREYAGKVSGHAAPGSGAGRGRSHRHGCC